ncbi:MAG: alcohol dehydrogenase catalytic domain-containing protein [Verrucomicrobia bacterium]|nr:alcohol dehydrogenase catalytic domain-containing protein [Verrucomicrobiota bacterium]
MIAATYTQGSGFKIEDIPSPELNGGGALLAIRAASICGTDVKIVRNGHRKLRAGQRIVLGHELMGEIVEAGKCARASGFAVGQRVGVAPNTGCGRCPACQSGRSNYCESYEAFGITRDGSHAELLRVPDVYLQQGNVMPLPDSVSDREATLLEPLSCVVNGLRASKADVGDRVVIYGPGTMGLLFLQVARLCGASQIIMVGRRDDRLQAALNAGADVAINNAVEPAASRIDEATLGEGADVVIIACASPEPQLEATEILAPFGRLCLFGSLPRGSAPPPFDTNAAHYKNLLITGTTGGSVGDYRAALRLAASGRIRLESIIGAEFPITKLQSAYDAALSDTVTGKIVLVR